MHRRRLRTGSNTGRCAGWSFTARTATCITNQANDSLGSSTATNGTISNVYDVGGTLVEKTITFPAGSAPSTNPWIYRYVGPFVYRNDSLLYVLHEEGRARWLADSTKFKYDFFLKDHLGNVRMTVASDISAQGMDYLATHELASAGLENLVFTNIDKVRDSREWAGGPNNTKCARLNGGVDSLRTGTAILLNVMAGDNFELMAHAYYNSADDNNDPQSTDNAAMVESLIAALSGGGPGGPGGRPGRSRRAGRRQLRCAADDAERGQLRSI